ncbi:hypothetical protein DLM45_02440 [Hyphomicrobium methylovorum]|uniref:hypothetical protein n=1 Tax=Hyphomicrobium methylovorum TaxID=84 RepID=UPI0015E62DC1|nr:hypothetical protein [Hyphomicrobium methylovorum]MBA2125085.1 hypothetical protein [Hyphomicrobium methylovorum]
MRRPTTLDEQLAWWRSNQNGSVHADGPECGYFKRRMEAWSKTWIPVRIYLEQPIDWETGELAAPEQFRLDANGRLLTDHWTIWEAWQRLRPVTMDEWKWLTARQSLRSGSPATAYISDLRERSLM